MTGRDWMLRMDSWCVLDFGVMPSIVEKCFSCRDTQLQQLHNTGPKNHVFGRSKCSRSEREEFPG